jgi:hypothetical protein
VPVRYQDKKYQWLDELLIDLGARNVNAMDVSSYEGASIVFDLQDELPKDYADQWDIILDFGTTEHIFDQKSVYKNIVEMLKSGGLYIAVTPRTNWDDHGLYQFSPEFYHNLLAIYPIAIECYTAAVDDAEVNYFYYKTYGRDPEFVKNILQSRRTYNIVFVRKLGGRFQCNVLSTSPRYSENFHVNGPSAELGYSEVETLSSSEFISKQIVRPADKVGVIHIATGKYKKFTRRFVSSAIHGFEPSREKIFYIITDSPEEFEDIEADFGCKVKCLKIESEPWPYPTLRRFDYMARLFEQFISDAVTHVFFVNANAIFISAEPVDELRKSGKLLGFVRHPGYLKNQSNAPFETRVESTAYIPQSVLKGESYVQGFFFGGDASAFVELSAELRDRIETDMSHGVVAIWHDESHLNWARLNRWKDKSMLFDSGYAFPEGWKLDEPCRIFSVDKSKHFDLSFKR